MATSSCDHAGRTRWGICYFFDSTKLRHTEEALREAQVQLQRWNVELEEAVHAKTVEVLESQEQLCRLATEVNQAEQRKRKRFATELHDHLHATDVGCGKAENRPGQVRGDRSAGM